MRISLEEAEGKLTELARYARKGSDVIITKDGQPYLRLSAHQGYRQPLRIDLLEGAFNISDEAIDELFLSPTPPEEAVKALREYEKE